MDMPSNSKEASIRDITPDWIRNDSGWIKMYCSSFLIAYYGPNMEILGNVGSDMWQYKKVKDVASELETTASLFMIDGILAFAS